MHAGAANTSYGANSMLVQIGNKLQGLPPTTNKPAQLINHITTKAEGDKRDYIFCINQLAGGVGKGKGQFAVGADGVKDCTTGKYETYVCPEFVNIQALNQWVTTELSQLLGSNDPVNGSTPTHTGLPDANHLFGLVLTPKTLWSNAGVNFIQEPFGTSVPPGGRPTAYYSAFRLAALANMTATSSGNMPTLLPNYINTYVGDIVGGQAYPLGSPTTPSNWATVPQYSTTSNSLDVLIRQRLLANPEVKFAIDYLTANPLVFPDTNSNEEFEFAVVSFPEEFISTPLWADMRSWISQAYNSGVSSERQNPNIDGWGVYTPTSLIHGLNKFASAAYFQGVLNGGLCFTSVLECDTSVTALPAFADPRFTGHTGVQMPPYSLNASMVPTRFARVV